MINQPNWEQVKQRMMGYWNREAMDRCTTSIRVKHPGYEDFGDYNFYFDTETATRKWRERFENHTYLAESFPCLFPYFGTAGIAEYTGCKANRTPRTTWFEPWMEDDEPDASLIGYKCPEAFQRQKDALAELIRLSNGEYPISVTDNAGVMDALAEIRGTDNLMMDMIADPEFVEEALQRLLPIYKQTQQELFDLTRACNEGSIQSWMQLWAPTSLAQLQCDLSVMISPEMYKQFVVPELEELCDFIDYPVYHFDGQEQIRHLDALLSVKKLRAIQWTPVAGQPDTSHFIPQLQRIQRAGKNLVLFPKLHEVEPLLDNLSSRGLHLVIDGMENEDEAREMLKLIENRSKVRD